jgi:hypothetical protein
MDDTDDTVKRARAAFRAARAAAVAKDKFWAVAANIVVGLSALVLGLIQSAFDRLAGSTTVFAYLWYATGGALLVLAPFVHWRVRAAAWISLGASGAFVALVSHWIYTELSQTAPEHLSLQRILAGVGLAAIPVLFLSLPLVIHWHLQKALDPKACEEAAARLTAADLRHMQESGFCKQCVEGSSARSPGNISILYGFGRTFYGNADGCETCGSGVRVLWFAMSGLPLVPLGTYRVRALGEASWQDTWHGTRRTERFIARATRTRLPQVLLHFAAGLFAAAVVFSMFEIRHKTTKQYLQNAPNSNTRGGR